jgi:hypothetical protein
MRLLEKGRLFLNEIHQWSLVMSTPLTNNTKHITNIIFLKMYY